MPECGAKLRNRNAHCRKDAMANGRCRLHGGTSTGAKNPHSQRKHGIYDDVLSDEDKAFIDTVQLGNVDAELAIVRVQLRRALKLKQQFDADPYDEKLRHIVNIKYDHVPLVLNGKPIVNDLGEQVYVDREASRELAIPNLDERIHRWTGRIESLEKTRKELAGTQGSATPEETAQKIKDALDEIDGSVPDANS